MGCRPGWPEVNPAEQASWAAPDAQQFVKNEEHCAQRDGAVGQVEGRKVPTGPVKVQEIDHVPVQQPIDHVAQRATQNETDGRAKEPLAGV